MQIPEHFTELSIRMSEALDDSGAGKDTVMERRGTFLWRERMEMIASQLKGDDVECFHFGSQSEGTTTPGLQSDIDITFNDAADVNIMSVRGDWKAAMLNYLMLRDGNTPSQQYLLQVFRPNTQEPVTSLCNFMYVRKDSGQVLLSAERVKEALEIHYTERGELTTSGPSVSYIPNWDIVRSFHVRKTLPEIQHWIERCRGRHWPPVQLLDAAREAPCFLVPAGHPDSDYKREEWRLSPNLIERMLMFSFNMTQIKCSILLKLIKKSLFAKIVGDSITSFHCKTIMFYTIERTHPSLWREHNLMFLLWMCLHVLKRCLRSGRLPHYIIEEVNLFDGKLSKSRQRRLLVYIDSMIRNNLRDVFNIGIDKIGSRLQACSIRRVGEAGELGRVCLRNSISLLLDFERLTWLHGHLRTNIMYQLHSSKQTVEQMIRSVLHYVFEYSTDFRLKTVAFEFIKHLFLIQNSVQSSYCLKLRNVVDSKIIRRFQYSLNTDVASSHLKMASVLYCCGHLQAAVRVLEDVEKRYHSKVKAVCGCRGIEGENDLHVFANMISGNCENGFSEPPFAFCVSFLRQESYCTPSILLFEMHRNITEEEVAHRVYSEKHWMDSAEVASRPFLHYLQYLTYGGLGERDNQLHALEVFKFYMCDIGNKFRYHKETSLNLLGHCFEMEGDYKGALHYYLESLRYREMNNAAYWHVRRVLRLIKDRNEQLRVKGIRISSELTQFQRSKVRELHKRGINSYFKNGILYQRQESVENRVILQARRKAQHRSNTTNNRQPTVPSHSSDIPSNVD